MLLDVADGHATRIRRDHLSVEAREPKLAHRDQPRIEAPVLYAGDPLRDGSVVGPDRLLGKTIAMGLRRLLGIATEMTVHLGPQHALSRRLLQTPTGPWLLRTASGSFLVKCWSSRLRSILLFVARFAIRISFPVPKDRMVCGP